MTRMSCLEIAESAEQTVVLLLLLAFVPGVAVLHSIQYQAGQNSMCMVGLVLMPCRTVLITLNVPLLVQQVDSADVQSKHWKETLRMAWPVQHTHAGEVEVVWLGM